MGAEGAGENADTVTMRNTARERTDRIIDREDGTDIQTSRRNRRQVGEWARNYA
jgi:hypothetical protein